MKRKKKIFKPFIFGGIELSDGEKYGDREELDKLVDSDNIEDRLEAVKQHYGLDKLVYDPCKEVRNAVHEDGYWSLEELNAKKHQEN